MAGWTKMLIGMEVGQATLCSMGTQLPPEKGHTHPSPNFVPCLLWPHSWMIKVPLGTELNIG